MTKKMNLSEKESYSLTWILFENILLLLNWGIGFFLLTPFQYHGIPIIALIYLTILIVVQILLKKHNCGNCYYHNKRCHMGWGKISSLICKKGTGNADLGKKLSISYILQLPVITILSLLAGLVYGFKITHLILLGIFILINIFQAAILRKTTCSECKNKKQCKFCAIKTKH